MIQVQRVLNTMARAFAIDKTTLIERIQKWDREHGREATLTPETYKSFKDRRGQQGHFLTAIILLEYLVSHSREVQNDDAEKEVRLLLLDQLKASKKKRFERDVGHAQTTDTASIDRFSGAYALCRVESQTRRPCQELVILTPARSHEKARYATFVGHNMVARGRWHLLGPAIYVEGLGYRSGHQPDFMNLSFPCGLNSKLFGGVLTGLATVNRDPVTMSVLAIKIEGADKSLFQIGNNSDPEIIDEFCSSVPRTMDPEIWKVFEDAHRTLSENGDYKSRLSRSTWFEPNFVNATDPFVSLISGVEDLQHLIMPGLSRFCRKRR